ncbi:MAG: hypothetical protein PUC65_01820 [Clostridiales bacterium]|nr:hypothetical protein [Clostridiales bacterium]
MQPELYKKVLVALSASQELIEKSSFDCINQHDKVANLVAELMGICNHMTFQLEMINEQVDAMKALQGSSDPENRDLAELSEMLKEQSRLQAEVNQWLQSIIEEQSLESEVIHEMEMQIADQREILDEACYIEK